VKLYTELSQAAWKILCDEGTLHAYHEVSMAKDDPDFHRAYLWLIGQMEQRGYLRPTPEAYPLWAWTTEERIRVNYTYGHSDFPRNPPVGVVVEIEIPDNEVLLSDFELWHCVLNGSNADATERELWPKLVFDFTWYDEYYHGNGERDLQATFWTLHRDQVCRILPFEKV
jgi:hypothetical protein